MKFTKPAIVAAAVGIAFASSAASAARITTADCVKAASEVASAIDANQQSANLKAAKAEQSAGRYFCQSGMFGKGVEHYNQALSLLNQK
jgi:hypothetical protein